MVSPSPTQLLAVELVATTQPAELELQTLAAAVVELPHKHQL